MADALKADLYGPDGSHKGEVDLDPAIFGIEPNMGVIHQVVTAQLGAGRAGTHSTKTRREARGGGRKPWRQKGIGRARQGSIRAPHWVGGGVAHGPKPRSYRQRTNKKVRRLALYGALSARAAGGQVKVVEDLAWDEPKTKVGRQFLGSIGADSSVLVYLTEGDHNAELSFRNLPAATVRRGQLSAHDVVASDTIVFTVDSLATVGGKTTYEVSESDFELEEPAAEDAVSGVAGTGGDGE